MAVLLSGMCNHRDQTLRSDFLHQLLLLHEQKLNNVTLCFDVQCIVVFGGDLGRILNNGFDLKVQIGG